MPHYPVSVSRLLAIAALMISSPLHADTVFVSNEALNVVQVIDSNRPTAHTDIAVGVRPRGMVISPDGKTLYVAVSDDNRIDIVDVARRQVRGHLPSGPDPELIAINPAGTMLYAANENDNVVSFIDIAAQRIVREVPVGIEPEGMAVSPDGALVINTSETTSMVHFIAAASGELLDNIMVDTRPRFARFTADGKQLWVSSEARGTVTVIDTASHRVAATIDFENANLGLPTVQAIGIEFTRDQHHAFVGLGRGNAVAEIDMRTFAVVRTFPTGSRTWNIALTADDKWLYAANGLSGDVTVIDLSANRSIDAIRVGGKPCAVVTGP